jgi:hypothetical protein
MQGNLKLHKEHKVYSLKTLLVLKQSCLQAFPAKSTTNVTLQTNVSELNVLDPFLLYMNSVTSLDLLLSPIQLSFGFSDASQ